MSGNRRSKVSVGISPPCVITAFTDEDTAVLADVLDELLALHTVTISSAKPETAA